MVTDGLRLVLAEDDVLLREGLASLLDRSGFEVAGQAGDAARLLELVAELAPELVVVDIRMPPTHTAEGLEAARQIRQEHPDIGILVLSAHVEVEHAMELLASGRGIGYLLKTRVTDVEELVDTLQRIARGGSVVDPALVAELVAARRRDDPLAALSAREREVLALMAEGRSNAGIARRLWVTEGTVEKHVRSILTKLTLPETLTTTAGSWPCSPSSRPAEQVADGVGGQGGLGQEPDGRAGRDQLGVVLLGVGRDEDHGGGGRAGLVLEAPGQLQAALAPQVDVEQGDVRAQLLGPPEGFGAAGGLADDHDPLAFQEPAGGVQEAVAVVDDQAAQHGLRIAGGAAGHIPASWKLGPRRMGEGRPGRGRPGAAPSRPAGSSAPGDESKDGWVDWQYRSTARNRPSASTPVSRLRIGGLLPVGRDMPDTSRVAPPRRRVVDASAHLRSLAAGSLRWRLPGTGAVAPGQVGSRPQRPRIAGAAARISPSSRGAPASPATAAVHRRWWRRWNQTARTPNIAAPARKNST
jgi:DNA-binding NarL/FixJ family response regulator